MHLDIRIPTVVVIVAATAMVRTQAPPAPAPEAGVVLALSAAERPHELREWDRRLDSMLASGTALRRTLRVDTVLDGSTHERFDQYVTGVRVFGGDLSRQTRRGVTESMFGTLHPNAVVDTIPRLTEDDARARFAAIQGDSLPPSREVELVVVPKDDGDYALTWRTHVWTDEGWMHTFLDAQSGEVALQYNDQQTQAAVGTGTGVLGDRKKISAFAAAQRYYADDRLRPPAIVTYDMQGDLFKTQLFLAGLFRPSRIDVANDNDNHWTDGANVDCHVYLGWTYDYLFQRFGRRGLDDRDLPIHAITHPLRRSDFGRHPASVASQYLVNAFWRSNAGPDGRGVIVFGEGIPFGWTYGGQYWDYVAGALDVVSHELTHGLTAYSSRLIYRNESGALNESFSDIVGTSTEFFFQGDRERTAPANYVIGEDVVRPGGLRSMSNPGFYDDPDHYARRYRGAADNGGVHINSGIPNHAFYLAIEGGVNRTSGVRVEGVGSANREQIEKVFYRAFVYMLTSSANFSMARAATIQAAADLYGASSAAERAVRQAWTAVGVN